MWFVRMPVNSVVKPDTGGKHVLVWNQPDLADERNEPKGKEILYYFTQYVTFNFHYIGLILFFIGYNLSVEP